MLEVIIGVMVCAQLVMWAYYQTQLNILRYKLDQLD